MLSDLHLSAKAMMLGHAICCHRKTATIKHFRRDILEVLEVTEGWDLMIAHPPCTHLAISGAKHFQNKHDEILESLRFVNRLMNAKILRKCIENPISLISTYLRKPSQVIHPWQFGHGEVKSTCLWLTKLPLLVPTNIVSGRVPRSHMEPDTPQRWKNRSRTYTGIAEAMATQWGRL
jgi:hypothetical protein